MEARDKKDGNLIQSGKIENLVWMEKLSIKQKFTLHRGEAIQHMMLTTGNMAQINLHNNEVDGIRTILLTSMMRTPKKIGGTIL